MCQANTATNTLALFFFALGCILFVMWLASLRNGD